MEECNITEIKDDERVLKGAKGISILASSGKGTYAFVPEQSIALLKTITGTDNTDSIKDINLIAVTQNTYCVALGYQGLYIPVNSQESKILSEVELCDYQNSHIVSRIGKDNKPIITYDVPSIKTSSLII
jgi:hypothetical protein